MSTIEVVGSGDRRSLIKRFERKSKSDAVSELVDIHLTHCRRTELLEARVAELNAALSSLVLFTKPSLSNAAALNNAMQVLDTNSPQKSMDIPKKVGIGVGIGGVGTEENEAISNA